MCPELDEIKTSALHDVAKFANALKDSGADYPEYVVDYKKGRERALKNFKALD